MTLTYSKHKKILLSILKDIFTDASIAPCLGFKGGTAAMMLYDLPRYSVDLDFDLIDLTKKEEVLQKVTEIIDKYGDVTESRIKRFTILQVLSYSANTPNIKIEINLRNFNSRYEVKTLLGISMQVMVKEDMFAHKLMAMYERIEKTSRDIFDVHYFATKHWDINKNIVEKRSGMSFKETLEKLIKKLEQLDNKHILRGLGELMGDAQKDSTRAKLKEDTLFQLRVLYDNEK